MIDTSASNPAERSTSSLAGNIKSMVSLDLQLNSTISSPTPSDKSVDSWTIECGEDAIPPGWLVPPELRSVTTPLDCSDAIHCVTRGGQPGEPQTWESQAEWCYRSCGVFLSPGWSYAHVSFPRLEMAIIAQEIAQKCVVRQHDFMGGWVSIGGYFIVLVTGREPPGT
ncbi:MAG: hypothetical protein Q9161_005890 [Pseudevernia consocians]